MVRILPCGMHIGLMVIAHGSTGLKVQSKRRILIGRLLGKRFRSLTDSEQESWATTAKNTRPRKICPDSATSLADSRNSGRTRRWRRARSLARRALAARRSRSDELPARADAHAPVAPF